MSSPISPTVEPADPPSGNSGAQPAARVWLSVLAIIGASTFAVLLPMLYFGIPSGHDFEFHLNSWMEVTRQWHQGILYPRWAEMANFGFGEPRFMFYPPASWIVGGALGVVLPWKLVPAAYVWMVLTSAGYGMFLLARRYVSPRDAIFAAAFYAVNPYHLVVVYWRSAFAELMSGIWIPLLLLCVLRLKCGDRKSILRLAAVIAAFWLTNLPAAVMATYSLVLLIAVLAMLRRSVQVLWQGAMACALGMAATSFYLLPAAYEQRWVTIQQALDPIVRPSNNFLFTLMNDVMHNRFNRLVSIVAVLEIGILIFAVFLTTRQSDSRLELRTLAAAWGIAASILMLPITWLLWQYMPQLRFVQLPWRWLLCLNVAIAVLLTLATHRWTMRALVYLTLLVAVVAVWRWVQPPWWDKAADLQKMRADIDQERGYESVSEYLPIGASVENTPENPPRVVSEDPASIVVERWGAEEKIIVASAANPTRLVLRLFGYPAWQAQVNGRPIQYESDDDIRQVIVPIPKGESRVRVFFARTWDRKLGGVITALTLVLAFILWITSPRTISRPATSPKD